MSKCPDCGSANVTNNGLRINLAMAWKSVKVAAKCLFNPNYRLVVAHHGMHESLELLYHWRELYYCKSCGRIYW